MFHYEPVNVHELLVHGGDEADILPPFKENFRLKENVLAMFFLLHSGLDGLLVHQTLLTCAVVPV